jgi:hypothetical protein
MVYAKDVNIIGESLHNSREIVLQVTAEKAKYMILSLDHNASRSQYVQIDDSSFKR